MCRRSHLLAKLLDRSFELGASEISIGDLDGDGHPDIAVTGPPSGNVALLVARGDGTFGRPAHYRVDGGPAAGAIGRFNGHPDLVTANLGSDDVSVVLGRGRGTFRRAVNYPLLGAGDSLAVADLDRDGRPDLAVATFGHDRVSVLVNLGRGRFRRVFSY